MARKLTAPTLDPGQPGAAPLWARYYRARAARSYRRARKDERHAEWLEETASDYTGPSMTREREYFHQSAERSRKWAAEEREWARWCAAQARGFERKPHYV